jgi:hypothetical protein
MIVVMGPTCRHHQLQRKGDDEMHRRIHQTGFAPAEGVGEERAQRPAHRAGKSAEQRQVGDRPARAVTVQPPERREGGVVESAAHAGAQHDPGDEIERQRRREANAGKARGKQH